MLRHWKALTIASSIDAPIDGAPPCASTPARQSTVNTRAAQTTIARPFSTRIMRASEVVQCNPWRSTLFIFAWGPTFSNAAGAPHPAALALAFARGSGSGLSRADAGTQALRRLHTGHGRRRSFLRGAAGEQAATRCRVGANMSGPSTSVALQH